MRPRRSSLRRILYVSALGCVSVLFSGCPKGASNTDFHAGKQAEAVQDYDSAFVHYERALRADPENIEYKVNLVHVKFIDGQFHVEQGQKALAKGDLNAALAEFQKARTIDPSNATAEQETEKTMALLAANNAAEAPKTPAPPEEAEVLSGPPALKPLSRDPINIKMSNTDAKMVYDTIGKLAGLSVIFDPDFSSRRISADLPNVTLEEALDATALESKSFWKPVTSNIIFVAPDQPQKRKDVEDEVVKTFYLKNTLTPQDITEIVTGLRQLLQMQRVQQINAQNAIVIRDTPDKVMLASKIIHNIDKAKPEVLLQVQVVEAQLDRLRDLGILPGQSAVVQFSPRTQFQPSSSTSTTGTSSTTTSTTSTSTSGTAATLNALKHLGFADFSITLPGAQANMILTDTATRTIQNPEVRITDGEQAKLRIGERVPIATGSFQAGVGVGATASTGIINPLVNTQFTYLDVGVNIDVTPRVHPDGEVSLKLSVDVSNVIGEENIGGIQQPVIGQRKIEHEVRLKDGEVNVLGGLIQRNETKELNGWPGLAKIPFLKYFFADNHNEVTTDDVMILITPHIIRMPSINPEDLKSIAAGTDTNIRVSRRALESVSPDPKSFNGPGAPGPALAPGAAPGQPAAQAATAQLKFEPSTVSLKSGDTTTVGLTISGSQDLFSIPLMVQYNPAVLSIEEVRDGGFLSGGTQTAPGAQGVAIVQRIDQEHGQAIVSATRQPNTLGVNGNGTLLGFVVKAIGPGSSPLQIVQVNAKDSQQHVLATVSTQAVIQVQ
jgi:general secretion pathway protein D